MTISLEHIGKRFNYDWIFRGLNFTFTTGRRYAILGPNGSGKSTLLQIIAGYLSYNEGKVHYRYDTQSEKEHPSSDTLFHRLSLAAPYLELIEEFTLRELLDFHGRFKPFIPGISVSDIMRQVGLEQSADKQIRHFSSGMKQRAKLAQAFFSDTPLLLLDEPCTNLDVAGVHLYHHLMERYSADKLVIVSSNEPKEYDLCGEHLQIDHFKS
jgi:ABC-type multidrug transport system ATPase subunit